MTSVALGRVRRRQEEREELGVFTSHQESEGREEGRGWEEEVYGAAQWEERELQAQLD